MTPSEGDANLDVNAAAADVLLAWAAAGTSARAAIRGMSPEFDAALRRLAAAENRVPRPPTPMRFWHAWRDREGDIWIPRIDGTWWLLSESAVPDLATLQDRYGPLWDVGPRGVLPPPPSVPLADTPTHAHKEE